MELALDLADMRRYVSPVNPAIYPHLTLILMGIGLFFTAWFFIQVTSTKYTRDFHKEVLMAMVGSFFNGFGILFLLLWVGIYV
uniref:Dolichyl-diphosphooligosaccharide-protein glycosyltransferase subunit TMEM258 n=1 Tax=Ciona savignyi TaxID=51511 RepID=H2Y8G0_CIOSA